MTSEIQRCNNVVTTLSDVATKKQPKTNVVTTSCTSWVCSNASDSTLYASEKIVNQIRKSNEIDFMTLHNDFMRTTKH